MWTVYATNITTDEIGTLEPAGELEALSPEDLAQFKLARGLAKKWVSTAVKPGPWVVSMSGHVPIGHENEAPEQLTVSVAEDQAAIPAPTP